MRKLKLITWNLGYGAMGKEAEIAYEGGRFFIPSSRNAIRKNIRGIKESLKKIEADAYLLQELSSGSFLNYWHDIREAVSNVFKHHSLTRVSNFSLPLFFSFLKNEHGMATYIRNGIEVVKRRAKVFKSGEYFYRIFPRWDYALTTVINVDGTNIAIINTHLASFDKNGEIRRKQFKELITYAQKFSRENHHVVIGADWNMFSGKIDFVSKKDAEMYDEYVCPFPKELLPDGWELHCPRETPTMRAANRPYVKGQSTTASIDGFICSPGIRVDHMQALNFEFAHSDHNPVEIVISY